ncbi:hypothetical protein A1O3_07824 [Capronia epimyces CBS 606.96]|uniref:FAD dependent oxidoreductase domain-containing protein n=1 Tax=Capronia epimyces CBS 606.96 TaxID=1182542 RepID=W9XQE3_9EURO|nr:uncharacterized protein A1O3_07824 [Capronia epimyces CBS 606.96]EXJ79545.1 hypothetical protein A1O3_07824 [Capronia epimyces CBS 606.96]
MSLVIIGGGVIGLSIAYYTSLAQPGRRIIIIDSEERLLESASGFSGGYIVRDWFSPAVLALAELSFRLHRDLADANDGRRQWGYSESVAFSLVVEQSTGAGSDGETKTVRGEDWLLHGTSRAEVAKQYAAIPAVESQKQDQARQARKQDDLLRLDGSPVWANVPESGHLERISSPSGCAQVEPRELCEWLLQQCQAHGVQILLGTEVRGLVRDGRGQVVGVEAERRERHPQGGSGRSRRKTGQIGEKLFVPARDIVVSAGCWTPSVYHTLVGSPIPIGIRPLPGYSIVVRCPRYHRPIMWLHDQGQEIEACHSIFCPPTSGWTYSPEAMARMTRAGIPEIYVAGLNSEQTPLPRLASHSRRLMDPSKMRDLKRTAVALTGRRPQTGTDAVGTVSPEDDLEVVREALCFRPVSESGIPIISRVAEVETSGGGGLYVASGHGPWGITLSLGTGMVVSQLLRGIAPSVSVDAFALGPPAMKPKPSTLRPDDPVPAKL